MRMGLKVKQALGRGFSEPSVKVWGPEFRSPAPIRRVRRISINLELQQILWGSAAGQRSLINEAQVQRETPFTTHTQIG